MLFGDLLSCDEYQYSSIENVQRIQITGITSDSRNVAPGNVFVSIRGLHTDGARYVHHAIQKGAAVVVCESSDGMCSVPYVIVNNARRSLAFMLSRFWHESWRRMKIFAVTGTNGKTSTCAYLRQIFMRAGIKSASIGTLKSYIGRERFSLGAEDDNRMSTMTTPDPEQLYRILYEMGNAGVENLVIEASSHAFKLDKLAPIRFESSVFTNFSAEHLDFHKDMSDYLMSKCRVFEMSDKVYINSDDSICSFAGRAFGNKVIGYGAYDPSASIRATNIINHGIDGISYKLRTDNGSFDIRCRIPGGFTLYNSMAAASVAIGQGIDSAVIGEAISTLDGIDGRMERVGGYSGNNDIAVFIDYAHTERAMDSLLSSVLPFKRGGHRIVTLFGCGGERDREKRAPMGRVASVYSDLVIITEDNSRAEEPDQIIEDIMRGIDKTKPHKIIKNRRKAIEYAIKTAIPGDIILLVGKGHEEYELTSRGKAPFSERNIVLDCLARRTEE